MKRWIPIVSVLMVAASAALGEIEVISRQFSLPTTYAVPAGKDAHHRAYPGRRRRRPIAGSWFRRSSGRTGCTPAHRYGHSLQFQPAVPREGRVDHQTEQHRQHGDVLRRPRRTGGSVRGGVERDRAVRRRSGRRSRRRRPGRFARPVAVRIEGSDDLANWSREPDVTVRSTMDTALREFELPTPAEQKRFYRGDARVRP